MQLSLIALIGNEARVSHRVVALNTNNQESTISRVIRNYMNDFEEFGEVVNKSENVVNNGTGKQPKTYFLNEQQATLLLTYLRNSEVVRAFKVTLVKAFFLMREKLYQKEAKDNKKVVNGYKSQIVQHNKKIEFLEGQVATLKKMYESNISKSRSLLDEIETPLNQDVPQRVMELIDKGLKYDELNEKYKGLDMQFAMFKIMGNEAVNRMKQFHEQVGGTIYHMENVLKNGMQRDKSIGWVIKE